MARVGGTLVAADREGGGLYDPRSVQRPGDRGDTGPPVCGFRARDRDVGEDRVRGLPGSLPLAVCADLLHRLRAAGSERASPHRGLSLSEHRVWRLAWGV